MSKKPKAVTTMKWTVIATAALVVIVALWLGGKYLLALSDQPEQYDILRTNLHQTDDQNDETVLSELHAKGSDLSKATDVVFYLYIPALRDAQAAAATLRAHGYSVEVREPLGKLSDGTTESRYSVVAHIDEVPSLPNLRMNRALYKSLATRYKGEYDGWEAAIAQ